MSGFEQVQALAFDHYGTLFDKHAVGRIMEERFPGRGDELGRLWFSTLKQYCFLSGMMERYLSWDELTRRSLVYAGKSLGLSIDERLHDDLIQADLVLPPFPEVPAALARLSAKFTLVVLTMASPWMVEASQKHAGVDHFFKDLISAEPHRVYKPGAKAYELAVDRLGLAKENIGFVSGNSFDVIGGKHFGFPTFWLNRSGAPLDELGPQPDLVVSNLSELASALGA